MKGSTFFAFLFAILLGAFIGFWLTRKFTPIPTGMVLVERSKADSLQAYVELIDSLQTLANLPADTVWRDSIIIQEVPVYITTTPEPIDTLDSIVTYKDSLSVEGEINAWVKFKVNGFMEGQMEWGYTPIIREIETIIEKPVPYPVIKTVTLSEYVSGNYISLVAGGNDKMFIFGVDYDLVQQDFIYGLQYRRYGDFNVYGVKAGININALFNRIKNGP